MKNQIPAYFNWSGGKDSCLALHHVLQNNVFDVKFLVTTVNSDAQRVAMHGVRLELMQEQARQIGIPLIIIEYPTSADMQEYERAMSEGLKPLLEAGIRTAIFGDIFLEDLKEYRVNKLKEIGVEAVFPLWKRDTTELVNEFIDLNYKTVVVCVDKSKLGEDFIGKTITNQWIANLPQTVDPCGENGEFHTFAYDGPIFQHPVNFEVKEIVQRNYPSTVKDETEQKWEFLFADLTPAEER